MRCLIASFILIALLIYPAQAAVITSSGSGEWNQTGTWVGGVIPDIGDTAQIGAGHDIECTGHRNRVGVLVYLGVNSEISGSEGCSIIVMDWTSAVTGDDFFASEILGDDANNGTTTSLQKLTWQAAIDLGGVGDHVLFAKGESYETVGSVTFVGGGTVGSHGLGDEVQESYGPRPLWHFGATDSIRQTGSDPTTIYHTEIAFGDAMYATIIMDRVTAVAPAAIEFKLDVDHMKLTSTEPRVFDGSELGGGEDFLLPTVVWDFGDPGSGNWDRGRRALGSNPASQNRELGPVAFHRYESEGVYTARWKAYYGGITLEGSQVITITDPDVEWPASDTWCFADISGNGGNWLDCPIDTDGDGLCSDEAFALHCVDTNDFDLALEGTGNCEIDVDNNTHRCLFRRSDNTFTASETIGLGDMDDDWSVDVFGSGSGQLAVDASGIADPNLFFLGESPFGRIRNIDVTGDNTDPDSKAITMQQITSGECAGVEFDNLLVENFTTRQWGNTFNITGQTDELEYRPGCHQDNIVLINVEALDATDSVGGGLDIFWFVESGAILGSSFGNRQGDEHGGRVKWMTDTVIAHNRIGRVGDADDGDDGCGFNRSLLTIRNGMGSSMHADGTREDALAVGYTQRFVLNDNLMGTCRENNAYNVLVSPTNNGGDFEHFHSYFVINNIFDPGVRTATVDPVNSFAGTDFMVANNAFYNETGPITSTFRALRIENTQGNNNGETANTQTTRAHVYHNTMYSHSTNLNNTQWIVTGPDVATVWEANNLLVDIGANVDFFSNSGENPVQCNGIGNGCNIELASNTALSPSLPGSRPIDADWFDLNGTYSAGTPEGVIPDFGAMYLDVYWNCRDSATPWEGSHEAGGTPCLSNFTPPPAVYLGPFRLP